MWTPVPHDGKGEAKGKVGPHYLRGGQRCKPQQSYRAQAPAPEEEKPTSAAMGKVMKAIHLGRSAQGPDNGVGTKVAKELPAGREDDDRSEHDVEQRLGTVLATWRKKSEPRMTPGMPPSSIHSRIR
jgi:hypothetical protein